MCLRYHNFIQAITRSGYSWNIIFNSLNAHQPMEQKEIEVLQIHGKSVLLFREIDVSRKIIQKTSKFHEIIWSRNVRNLHAKLLTIIHLEHRLMLIIPTGCVTPAQPAAIATANSVASYSLLCASNLAAVRKSYTFSSNSPVASAPMAALLDASNCFAARR